MEGNITFRRNSLSEWTVLAHAQSYKFEDDGVDLNSQPANSCTKLASCYRILAAILTGVDYKFSDDFYIVSNPRLLES